MPADLLSTQPTAANRRQLQRQMTRAVDELLNAICHVLTAMEIRRSAKRRDLLTRRPSSSPPR